MSSLDFGSYSAALNRPGALAFYIAGWFGRYPRSTLSLSIILLVAAESGSYRLAGSITAALVIAMGLSGPLWSRAMDTYGQRKVLLILTVTLLLTASLFLVVVSQSDPSPLWFVAAAFIGLTVPDIGSVVRSRWRSILPPRSRPTGFALEAIADESVFVIAPPLVTILASTVNPILGVVTAVVFGVAGTISLATLTGTMPLANGKSISIQPRTFFPPSNLWPVTLGFIGIGGIFGAFDVSAVAWSEHMGQGWYAGLIMAVMAIGNVAGSLLYGARLWASSIRQRYLVLSLAVVASAFVTAVVATSAVALLLTVLVFGVILGPFMVTSFSLIETRTPVRRVTETLAYPSAALSVGVPFGSTLAGAALDAQGVAAGFAVLAALSVIIVVAGTFGELLVERRHGMNPEVTTNLSNCEGRDSEASAASGWVDAPSVLTKTPPA